jgi:Holliday junction resolvasome RuvABC endonuclease subunit
LNGTAIVAVGDDGGYQAWRIEPKQKVNKKRKGAPQRLIEIEHACSAIFSNIKLTSGGVDAIVMEDYAFSKQMGHSIGEGGGVVRLQLIRSFGTPLGYPTIVTNNQLKQFVTGKGLGDKNVVMMHVLKKWGVESPNDDVADGYALAMVAQAQRDGISSFAYEAEVLAKIEAHTEWDPPSTRSPQGPA